MNEPQKQPRPSPESQAADSAKLESTLKEIYEDIRHWVNFAEAKNAFFVAANGSVAAGVVQGLMGSSFDSRPYLLSIYLWELVICCAIGMVCALMGLLPKGTPFFVPDKQTFQESDNFLFFGDIAKCEVAEYLTILQRGLSIPTSSITNAYHERLATQAIVNSRVAQRKYRCCRAAIWCSVAALMTPGVMVAIALFINRRRIFKKK